MKSLHEQLHELLQKIGDSWTPEERSLAEGVAEDYATLMIKRVAGDDISTEVEHVRAQAASIIAAGTISLSILLEEEIRRFLTELIAGLALRL